MFLYQYSGKKCVLILVREKSSEKDLDNKNLVDMVKSSILKSFSHELLTPLNGIFGSFEIIKSKLLKYQNHELYNDIINPLSTSEACSFKLKTTIRDFVDFQEMDTSALKLNIESFNVREFIEEIEKIFR
jgi:signal transduction histidine kinase